MKNIFIAKLFFLFSATFFSLSVFSQTTLIPYSSSWKYLDNGSDQGTAWRASGFNDASWKTGNAKFGYGDAATTVVFSGCGSSNYPASENANPSCGTKYITTYFRKTLTIADKSIYSDFTINLIRDDGAVIYVNGVQVVLSNMPGTYSYTTGASSNINGSGETQINPYTVATTDFVNGTNTIAVEIHQDVSTSSDLGFDFELIGNLAPASLIAYNASWKYLDNGTDQGTAWQASGFNDASWKTGNAKFGYGDAATTVIFSGCGSSNFPAAEDPAPSCGTKFITTYFRENFTITGLSGYGSFDFNVIRDDGYVIYINGVEAARDNMPGGAVIYTTGAVTAIGGTGETTPVTFNISACSGLFVEGTNTIAVEIHQTDGSSSDVGFNLELIGNPGGALGTPTLTRGPYLQVSSETGQTFRWRTNTSCYGRVRVGLANGTYTTASADETCPTTEHIVRVTGLASDTKYFYQISATDGTILQGAVDNFFRTNPPANTTRKIRITAFGDCGRGNATYQDNNLANYQTYLTANGIDAPDAWLMLGDNAYSVGSDAEYTSNYFNIYGSNILKNHKMYPTPGNHDYGNNSGNKTSRSMAYHQNFTVPMNGEAGGVASNKQNYYSYDLGNIHFLALDSYGIESDGTDMQTAGTSALKTWLTADLAANTKKWVIAYWHHPPYTKSSHNSDSEGDLVNIRQNFIGFLENNGVDLIINGHSHAYERGYLLRNFTGSWTSFNPATHAVSTSSATYTSNSTCPYVYNTSPSNHGTVYVVAGSTGASGGTNAGFGANALPFAVNDAGIFYFEVEDNRLDAKMLRRDGSIFDRFTIIKDVNNTANYNILNGTSQNLTASWPQSGGYTWTPSLGTTRSVNVTPSNDATTNYTVTDAFGCIADQFSVTTSGTLPVSLINFNAKMQYKKVYLNWASSSEINNSHFTIERSSNGVDFSAIATINGAGNSSTIQSYSYIDQNPLAGISYYRLVQINFDNQKEYAGIKRIENNDVHSFDAKTLAGYANKLVLQIDIAEAGKYNIRVHDLNGREVYSQLIKSNGGVTRKEINLTAGVYAWEVRNEKGESKLNKVIVR